jgi:hypothetical protein
MKKIVAALGLMAAIVAPAPVAAQLLCATNFGTCPMATGVPGGPCFCASATGPIQGITRSIGGNAGSRFPQYCCTPAGRIGPFPNTTVGPGQTCQAPTPAGMMFGQACY